MQDERRTEFLAGEIKKAYQNKNVPPIIMASTQKENIGQNFLNIDAVAYYGDNGNLASLFGGIAKQIGRQRR